MAVDSSCFTENWWQQFRDLMPVTRNWAYLDHAAVSPLPLPTSKAISRWAAEAAEQGVTAWAPWRSRVEQVRQRAAGLIGAQPQQIALIANTTTGINLVAEGYPWQPGDNVVTLANEFPSNLYPWMNLASRGVETRRVEVPEGRVDLDRLLQACDRRTRLIAASWVGYASGWRLDVEQLVQRAHDRGILVFLDAIQGLGVFPLDVQRTGVDFLAADGHKWMLGPEGAGIFYLRTEHLQRLRPLGLGWHSVVHAHDYSRIELNLRPDAARYEGGSHNMAGLIGLGESLDLLARFGLAPDRSPLAHRVLQLTELAAQRLEALGARIHSPRQDPHRSGIVAFELPSGDPASHRQRCLQAGVALSCRGGHLRISPHAYGSEEDVQRLVDVLR